MWRIVWDSSFTGRWLLTTKQPWNAPFPAAHPDQLISEDMLREQGWSEMKFRTEEAAHQGIEQLLMVAKVPERVRKQLRVERTNAAHS